MRSIICVAVLCAWSVFFVGCEDKLKVSKVDTNKTELIAEEGKTAGGMTQPVMPSVDGASASEDGAGEAQVDEDISLGAPFQDSAKVSTSGKYSILVFGSSNDPYSQSLQQDVVNNKDLFKRLNSDFNLYYISTDHNKIHAFEHMGEYKNTDTKTFINLYDMQGTPTIIFYDLTGRSVLVVPGYMPPHQFLVTLDFIEQKEFAKQDKAEVYDALKKFYTKHGVLKK